MILVVAEKPSVARTIAKVLDTQTAKDGYIVGKEYIVSWCLGHLIGLSSPEAYDEKYSVWTYDTLPIIPDEWMFSINENTKKQYETLRKLMTDKEVDEIVCATDAGREGECIFRYVYEKVKCRKPVKRLWVSSLEEKAIRQGFENLKASSEYDDLYKAGLRRAEADWLVGMNFTRLFSVLYKQKLNIGRVQTPTLAMLCEREEQIKKFVKEKYFTVEIDCGFTASSERIDDKVKAGEIREKCISEGKAEVSSVEKEIKTINPPKLYDLTTLQREANRIYGYTAQQTLDLTQKLYEAKLCTYPRTDSSYITDDMEQTVSELIYIVSPILSVKINYTLDIKRIINNSKVSDHTALLPTAELTEKKLYGLPEDERNILKLIAFKLLCATAQSHKFEAVSAKIICADTEYTAKGKTVINNGWKDIECLIKENAAENEVISLPETLAEGLELKVSSAEVSEHWTSPPKHYTEDTLLSAMEHAGNKDYEENSDTEKKGLGSPATRAGIIENLVKREYVKRDKKQLIPLDKGTNLINVVPESVKSPKMTAEWETKLQKIEKGQLTDTEFMDGIIKYVTDTVSQNTAVSEENKYLFSDKKEKEILGKCPKCSGNVYESKSGFYCENSVGDKRSCSFYLKKGDKFFTWKRNTLGPVTVKALLKNGKAKVKGFYSEKSGKTYDATVVMDTGGQYPKFSLEFDKKKE